MAGRSFKLELRGPKNEPVNLARSLQSHGVAALPPMAIDPSLRSFRYTCRLPDRVVTLSATENGDYLKVSSTAALTAAERTAAKTALRHIFRLEADLSGFYVMAAEDPALAWVVSGAGRMMRCASVYEDVVKTICTTNCNWGATEKMVAALVRHLGDATADAPADSASDRAFPTPRVMAARDDAFYRQQIRAGYRSPYFIGLANLVQSGELNLESLGDSSAGRLSDDEVFQQLLSLPGVGPYAAAHIMTMLGRYSRLILDSWTRPTFAERAGLEQVSDAEITERFGHYGEWAGLAFWLYLTRAWIDDQA